MVLSVCGVRGLVFHNKSIKDAFAIALFHFNSYNNYILSIVYTLVLILKKNRTMCTIL